MKVLITPTGEETQYPLAIRLIMYLPIPKYRRWRLRAKAISRLKPALLTVYNLPKQMPEDFEFKYDHRVMKLRETKRTIVSFGNVLRLKEVVLKSEMKTLPDMDAVPETMKSFSSDQKQKLYDAIRNLGFIHFETNNNMEVSFDSTVQTNYKLICKGREYSYSSSTTEPTRSEWSEEELKLDGIIMGLVKESVGRN